MTGAQAGPTELTIAVGEDGLIDAATEASPGASVAVTECDQIHFVLDGRKWTSTLVWSINYGSFPASVTVPRVKRPS